MSEEEMPTDSVLFGDGDFDDNPVHDNIQPPQVFSHTPINCPVSFCGKLIGATSVLAHFLREHTKHQGVPFQEMYARERSVLVFDARRLYFRHVKCLGVLAYGGMSTNTSTRPAERGICRHNTFLPMSEAHLNAHLPLFVMACKTSWSALLKDKATEALNVDPANTSSHMLVLWLASTQKLEPMHCTLTVYAHSMMRSRSAFVEIRNINEPQNPSDYLYYETNALLLSGGEVEYLSNGGRQKLQLEIIVNEVTQ